MPPAATTFGASFPECGAFPLTPRLLSRRRARSREIITGSDAMIYGDGECRFWLAGARMFDVCSTGGDWLIR